MGSWLQRGKYRTYCLPWHHKTVKTVIWQFLENLNILEGGSYQPVTPHICVCTYTPSYPFTSYNIHIIISDSFRFCKLTLHDVLVNFSQIWGFIISEMSWPWYPDHRSYFQPHGKCHSYFGGANGCQGDGPQPRWSGVFLSYQLITGEDCHGSAAYL